MKTWPEALAKHWKSGMSGMMKSVSFAAIASFAATQTNNPDTEELRGWLIEKRIVIELEGRRGADELIGDVELLRRRRCRGRGGAIIEG